MARIGAGGPGHFLGIRPFVMSVNSVCSRHPDHDPRKAPDQCQTHPKGDIGADDAKSTNPLIKRRDIPMHLTRS